MDKTYNTLGDNPNVDLNYYFVLLFHPDAEVNPENDPSAWYAPVAAYLRDDYESWYSRMKNVGGELISSRFGVIGSTLADNNEAHVGLSPFENQMVEYFRQMFDYTNIVYTNNVGACEAWLEGSHITFMKVVAAPAPVRLLHTSESITAQAVKHLAEHEETE